MAQSTASAGRSTVIPLASLNGLELGIQPRAEKSIGNVIADPAAKELISGVKIEPLKLWADDRGMFAELFRLGTGLSKGMDFAKVQMSFTTTYPGAIKALHYHSEQTDIWAPLAGMLQVVLVDLRRKSETFGAVNTLYIGKYRMWELLIPPGVGHGYKVLGTEPAQLVYLTDRFYNPADEGRIAYDDAAIHYDWELQHK